MTGCKGFGPKPAADMIVYKKFSSATGLLYAAGLRAVPVLLAGDGPHICNPRSDPLTHQEQVTIPKTAARPLSANIVPPQLRVRCPKNHTRRLPRGPKALPWPAVPLVFRSLTIARPDLASRLLTHSTQRRRPSLVEVWPLLQKGHACNTGLRSGNLEPRWRVSSTVAPTRLVEAHMSRR